MENIKTKIALADDIIHSYVERWIKYIDANPDADKNLVFEGYLNEVESYIRSLREEIT